MEKHQRFLNLVPRILTQTLVAMSVSKPTHDPTLLTQISPEFELLQVGVLEKLTKTWPTDTYETISAWRC